MIFQSALNPELKSTQELIVLCHGAQRVLVPLPETFEDIVQVAAREFGLQGALQLATSELRGYADEPVRIHACAWKGVSALLKSVTVEEAAARRVGPRQSVARTASRVVVHGPGEPRLSDFGASLRSSFRAAPPTPSSSASARSARVSAKKRGLDGDATEDEEEHGAAKRSRRAPSLVRTDDGGDSPDTSVVLDESLLDASVAEQPRDVLEEDGLEYIDVPLAEKRAETPPPAQQPQAAAAEPLVPEPAREESQVPEPVREQPQEEAVAPPAPVERPPTPVRVKAEKVPPQEAKEPALKVEKAPHRQIVDASQASQPSGPGTQRGEDSFLVTIEYGDADDEENQMLFKTRGRHLVGKVLMQACRTFGIEALFDRARLVLMVEIEEEDEVVEHRFACARDETMAQVGAEPNCKFAVEVVDGK